MNKELLIQKFCLDYDVKRGSETFNNLTLFADDVLSTAILAKVLDSSNHPTSDAGRKIRPNIATLKVLLGQFIVDRAEEKRRESMSILDDEDCFYCTCGHILGIQERNGLWSTLTIGRCECRRGDDTGHLAYRKPTKPSKEIQEYARESGLSCPLAADKMIYERNQEYRGEEPVPF